MGELLRHYLLYSIHSLTKYDVMAIGWVVFLAFLLMFLGAFLRHRALSYFLLFLGLTLLFFGPPAIKVAMDGYIRNARVEVHGVKRLRFSPTLIVEGEVANRGKVPFSSCDLVLSVYRPDSPLGEWGALLKPLRVDFARLEGPIERGEAKPFRITVDPFTVRTDDYNVTVRARCYP